MSPEKERPSLASETTLELLSAIHDRGRAGIDELASELGRSTDAVERHLSLLETEQYVTETDDGYRIGFRMLEFGGQVRKESILYRQGRSEIDELAAETGEQANLMTEEYGLGVHLYLAKGAKAVTFDTHAGKRFWLHNNALGKAILAELPAGRVDEIVDHHGLPETTENTVTDRGALHDQLSRIRDRGYATDDEERLEGLRCVAAPVTADGQAVGAVSVSGPATRIKGERFRETLPEKVVRTADLLGLNISYS